MTEGPDDRGRRASALAARLLDAHRLGRPIEEAEAPATVGEAYAVQRLVAGRLGRVVGWKVGRKAPSAPIVRAPVLDTTLVAAGAEPPRMDGRPWLIEAELVFAFRRDLPPREKPYTPFEVREAIGDVRPGIEVVASRLAAWPDAPPLLQLADLQSHGLLAVGDPAAGLPPEPWHRRPLRLTVDGRTAAEGEAENPAGDLLDLMTRLADHLATTAGGLRAGDLVTTGSFAGMTPLAPGAVAEAVFEGIGRVTLAGGR